AARRAGAAGRAVAPGRRPRGGDRRHRGGRGRPPAPLPHPGLKCRPCNDGAMRITGLASTDLFTGTEPQPRQVIRVTVAEPGPGRATVKVSGPGVRPPEPATVTGPADGANEVTAEVGVELAAPHGPLSRLRVTAVAEGSTGRATLDGEITA